MRPARPGWWVLMLAAAAAAAGGGSRVTVVEPEHGAAVPGGRTAVAWRVRGAASGELVSVFLDGELLAVTAARPAGSLHLLGAPPGPHELIVALSRAPMRTRYWVRGADHGETAAVEFASVGEAGGEWTPPLASLRNTFLRADQRLFPLDARARDAEHVLQALQRRLRSACGVRALSPTAEVAGCSAQCTAAQRARVQVEPPGVCPRRQCSPTCCRISGRCVELLGDGGAEGAGGADKEEVQGEASASTAAEAGPAETHESEERLAETYARLLDLHHSYSSRLTALQSAPPMRPGAPKPKS